MWIEIQRIKNKPKTVRKYLQSTFDKRLVSKIYKELLKVNYNNKKQRTKFLNEQKI